MTGVSYDELGRGYSVVRRTDPRIAARIDAVLGNAGSVLNVGAGTGSYEPPDRDVTAVEPSAVMISQRSDGAAPAVQASAEELPFEDNSFDAAMAIFTDHHWSDREAGLREVRRVARRRVVLLNADPVHADSFWLTRDYLPGVASLIPAQYREAGCWRQELQRAIGQVEVEPVMVPHDCADGFYQSFWRRPRAYLDPRVRDGTTVFRLLPRAEVQSALQRLRSDLDSGDWQTRYGRLLGQSELDLGLRLVVAEVG